MFYSDEELKEIPLADLYILKKEIESVYQEIREDVKNVMPEFKQLDEGLNYPPLLGTTKASPVYQRYLARYNNIIDLFNEESAYLAYLVSIDSEIFYRTGQTSYRRNLRKNPTTNLLTMAQPLATKSYDELVTLLGAVYQELELAEEQGIAPRDGINVDYLTQIEMAMWDKIKAAKFIRVEGAVYQVLGVDKDAPLVEGVVLKPVYNAGLYLIVRPNNNYYNAVSVWDRDKWVNRANIRSIVSNLPIEDVKVFTPAEVRQIEEGMTRRAERKRRRRR